MAEGTSVRKDGVVCRFFLTSSCRDGDKCLFSHDRTCCIPDSVCRYYLQGTCMFGDRCRYDHVKVKKQGNVKPRPCDDVKYPAESSRCSNRDSAGNSTVSNYNREKSYRQLNLTTLRNEMPQAGRCSPVSPNWINAPEFVPKATRSYADTVRVNTAEPENFPPMELCPYFMIGECIFEDRCPYVHGIVCELCNKACLNPYDEDQRKAHNAECEKELEQDMELSFAIHDSLNKTCGICMDVVLTKEPMSERRFGILQKCNHVFCLSCIRKWRRSTQHESDERIGLDPSATRGCPECRVASDYVIPSSYFVESVEEKNKLITDYKQALNKKRCKYFKQGEGNCPFGGSCFYLHAKPDGTVVNLPPLIRRRRQNQDGELNYMDQVSLLDFLIHRESNGDIMFPMYDSDEEASDNGEGILNEILDHLNFQPIHRF